MSWGARTKPLEPRSGFWTSIRSIRSHAFSQCGSRCSLGALMKRLRRPQTLVELSPENMMGPLFLDSAYGAKEDAI